MRDNLQLAGWDLIDNSYDDIYQFYFYADSDILKKAYQSAQDIGDVWLDTNFKELDFCELVCQITIRDGKIIQEDVGLYYGVGNEEDTSDRFYISDNLTNQMFAESEDILYSEGILN